MGKILRKTFSWSNLKKIFLIILGSFIMAIPSTLLFDRFSLVTGGVTGISIIIKHFTGIDLWKLSLLINIPLFIIAFFVRGKEVFQKSLFGMLVYTLALYVTNLNIDIFQNYDSEFELLLAGILGGAIAGLGEGLVFRGMGTTGGTDLLAAILKRFLKFIPISNILAGIEVCISTAAAIVFGVKRMVVAIIAIYVYTLVANKITEGFKSGKCIYIISPFYMKIANEIMSKTDRGVTALNGEGMYSRKSKKILFCIAQNKEIPAIKDIVRSIDPKAFMFVNDSSEVLGEGFIENEENEVL